MAVDTVITTFESDSQRIVWLPSVTLAYIFTISGEVTQLVTAIAAIGGAQWFILLINTEFDSDGSGGLGLKWFLENFSHLALFPLSILSIVYVFATVYALIELYKLFRHQDIVLVGLAIIWGGVAMVVLVNTIVLFAKIDDE